MKPFAISIIFLALNFHMLAQPTAITWQGKLLDNSGNAINQNNVSMNFAMFDASTGGTKLWPTSGVVTKTVDVVNGLYSVQLGTGTGDDITFTVAMFDGHTPWLEVKVGTETLPRTEITNVPFALISNDLSAAAWETPGEIGKTTPNTGKFTSVETGSVKISDDATDGKVLTSDADGNANWETPAYQSSGTAPGQMQYWDGTAWITVAPGQEGQFLRFSNSTPTWVTLTDVDLMEIGDIYQGGIIAYFLQPGDPGYDANVRHGLIAAPTDQSISAEWGCYATLLSGADGTDLGTGAQNTIDIVAGCTAAGIAAQICNDLVMNGYSDWYLPSNDELNKLYLNKNAIGGFASAWYWNSSESSSDYALRQYFGNGYQYFGYKNINCYVRAVRTF